MKNTITDKNEYVSFLKYTLTPVLLLSNEVIRVHVNPKIMMCHGLEYLHTTES